MTVNDFRATFVRTVECFQLEIFYRKDDLTILGILVSVGVEEFLE
jgi:hypothetical protein